MVNTYSIADFLCSITFVEGQESDATLLPSLVPFRVEEVSSDAPTLFVLDVDDSLTPLPEDRSELVQDINNETINVRVAQSNNGAYEFIIRTMTGESCCLLQTNADFTRCRCALRGSRDTRAYGLNNALMLVFAFASCAKNTLLLHASVVRHDGRAYAFIAKSGTGKSTHTNLWMANIAGCDILNDDNPVLRVVGDDVLIYGSPWSGKTACYRNTKASAGAITKVHRHAESNFVVPTPAIEAFASLLAACATMKWDSTIYEHICHTITRIVELTPHFNLFCRPVADAAIVCHKAIALPRRG